MKSTRKREQKRGNYVQPSSISPVFPTGLGIGESKEMNTILIDFTFNHPESNDTYVVARVALIPKLAEYLRDRIDKFLARAKTEKRSSVKKT